GRDGRAGGREGRGSVERLADDPRRFLLRLLRGHLLGHQAAPPLAVSMPSSPLTTAPAATSCFSSFDTVPLLIPVRSVMSRSVRAPSRMDSRTRSRLVTGPAGALSSRG